MSADRIEFSEPVRFKAERGFNHAVAHAARQARTSGAAWMREAIRLKLKADGISLPDLDAPAVRQAA